MTTGPQPSPGFFPSLISVLFFIIIMVGMFFGFTKLYPDLLQRYQIVERIRNGEDNTAAKIEAVAERIAPFVRGIVSGIETAQLSSFRETGPLDINLVNGYQHGMKTALLASNNWYNIDRQLFRSKGIFLGASAAELIAKPNQESSTPEFQIKLIQQIQGALATDLNTLLSVNDENRRRALENYLNGLKKLSTAANTELENMGRLIGEAQNIISQNMELSEQYNDSFGEDLSSKNVDMNLELYLEARKKIEEAKVRGASTKQIYDRLKPLANQLPAVISAIQSNFDALAAGIKVTPTKGVNLPIFQE